MCLACEMGAWFAEIEAAEAAEQAEAGGAPGTGNTVSTALSGDQSPAGKAPVSAFACEETGTPTSTA